MACAVALGSASVVSSALGSVYGARALNPGEGVLWLEYLSAWLGSVWAWALFAYAVGWFTSRGTHAVARAALGLLLAVVIYYVCKAALGLTSGVELRAVGAWAAPALVAGPVMALLGYMARWASLWSLPAALIAPALMVADTRLRPTGPDHIHPGSQYAVYGVAALLVVVLIGRVARRSSGARDVAEG